MQRMTMLAGCLMLAIGCGTPKEQQLQQPQQGQPELQQDTSVEQGAAPRVIPLSAFETGAAVARQSIEQDILQLKEYPPLPYPPGHNFYVALLEKECGVKGVVGKPGDTPEDQFIKQVQGWNSVMRPEIQRRFGEDIFERLQAEAQRQFQDSRGAQEVKPTPILGNR